MAEERVQRRLAAILAPDVVGYSRLMGPGHQQALPRPGEVAENLATVLIEDGGTDGYC